MAENKDHSSIKKMAEGIDRLNDWLGRIAAFLIYPGMLILAYEVGARYLFNAPTIWAHGTSQRIFAVYFIVGAPYVLLHKGHIRMDMIYNLFPPRIRAIIDLITAPMLFVTIFVLLWFGGDFAWSSVSAWERDSTPLHAPVWPIKIWIPVTGFLLFLQALTTFFTDVSTAFKGIREASARES